MAVANYPQVVDEPNAHSAHAWAPPLSLPSSFCSCMTCSQMHGIVYPCRHCGICTPPRAACGCNCRCNCRPQPYRPYWPYPHPYPHVTYTTTTAASTNLPGLAA